MLSIGIALALLMALVFGLALALPNLASTSSAPNAGSWDTDGGPLVIPPDRSRQLAEFSLTDQNGRTIHRRDIRGNIVAVSFLFTSCTVVCPYVSAQMEKIQQATANLPNVRLMSITYDPADDTQQVLAAFAHSFNANAERWLFLTGNTGAVRDLIRTSFLDEYKGEFAFPGVFRNTQRIALLDPQGNLVSYFDGLNNKSGDAVIARIRQMELAR